MRAGKHPRWEVWPQLHPFKVEFEPSSPRYGRFLEWARGLQSNTGQPSPAQHRGLFGTQGAQGPFWYTSWSPLGGRAIKFRICYVLYVLLEGCWNTPHFLSPRFPFPRVPRPPYFLEVCGGFVMNIRFFRMFQYFSQN